VDGGRITHRVQTRRVRIRGGHLRCTAGPDAGRSWPLDRPRVAIGTLASDGVVLADDTVSRRHAELVRSDHGWLLRDLDSTNGTTLAGVRVHEVEIGPDVPFVVGGTELVVSTAPEVVEVRPSDRSELGPLVGGSARMRELYAVIERIAPTDLTVLATGETGTGKELVARAVHDRSPRRDRPFVVFDCGAVAANLVEAQLFGHEKGAFTGAATARAGVFEAADGGTLFVDEVGELPLELQPKLLRALEGRTVQRLGETRTRAVDVRVVAATNRSLEAEVRAGRFRSDLYFRLAVVEIELPPLRQRTEDLPQLVSALLARLQPRGRRVLGAADEVLEVLAAYRWPGNVRELANVLGRALAFTDGPRVGLAALPPALRDGPPGERDPELAGLSVKEARERLLDAFERRYFHDLWREAGGNLSRVARIADLDRKSARRLLRKHGLSEVSRS
jgi:DNA-binding NtrC family response regulator